MRGKPVPASPLTKNLSMAPYCQPERSKPIGLAAKEASWCSLSWLPEPHAHDLPESPRVKSP